ncbi:MAG: RluA family pseudouridine synthase [Oribacterium sp.]|nr:RluA family pseudouridine synthase [Oribacterium sp.]
MKIIHQTAEYVVVCKAAGEDSEHDLPEMLAEQNGDQATDYYVVHRLDQAVAGLLVLARNRVTAAELSRQLTENRLRKTYLCVVPGVPAPASGEMQDLLYQDKMKRKMFPVKRKRAGVKEASLRYHVLETKLMNTTVTSSKQEDTAAVSASQLTLVEVELQTGRFHQIRCQFAARKLPLVGDGKYGSRVRSPHLALFCRQLSFYDATEKKECFFTAVPPAEFPWEIFYD